MGHHGGPGSWGALWGASYPSFFVAPYSSWAPPPRGILSLGRAQPSHLRTLWGSPGRDAGRGTLGRRPSREPGPGPDSCPSPPVASRASSTLGQVGRQLAIIGDDINQRFDLEFHTMLQHLQPTPENAYQYFTKIASR